MTSADLTGAWDAATAGRSEWKRPSRAGHEATPLAIGLVNNMPDAALRSTERQFRELLAAAAPPGTTVHLRLITLPEVPRSDAGRAHVHEHYESFGGLWADQFDGLIVTGTEPRAPSLSDEPYWPALVKLIEWAESHTASTIWSCLAAHAAVLHLDGIARRPLPGKLSGVFEVEKASDHPVLAGTAPRRPVPHSRYNGLDEDALVARGYRVLAWSHEAGADTITKHGNSLFIFLQGHPEYDAGALLREYHRDVGRFLTAERNTYPDMPRGYFGGRAAATLATFRERALQERSIGLLAKFPAALETTLVHAWHESAVQLYANWLGYLAAQKSQLYVGTRSELAEGVERTLTRVT